MPQGDAASTDTSPNKPIRRFDSLCSTRARSGARKASPRTKPKGTASGWPRSWLPADSARNPPRTARNPARRMSTKKSPSSARSVTSSKPNETFDHDIIDRMGTRFYDEVFVPAIAAARKRAKNARPSATRSAAAGSRPAPRVNRRRIQHWHHSAEWLKVQKIQAITDERSSATKAAAARVIRGVELQVKATNEGIRTMLGRKP